MDRKHLGRRCLLSDGLAFASACMLPGKAGAMTPLAMDDADQARVELLVSDDHDILRWSPFFGQVVKLGSPL